MDQIKVGRFIAQLRHEHNMTQEALGQRIGVTNKTISRWENGNYMPDIEMLKMLSDIFSVSINELFCGEKLSDENFRKKADENIADVYKTCSFTIKERYSFWKKRWLKAHSVLIVLCVLLFLGFIAWGWYSSIKWLSAAAPFIGFVLYAKLRNSMMIYIENKIYR